jgi:hypothetical protein
VWISRKEYKELYEQNTEIAAMSLRDIGHLRGLLSKTETETARLKSEMNWFKHRLNQVERERGQLIQAAIGVKVAVPEFVPTYEDPGQALNEMPNLSTVGGDAVEELEIPGEMNPGIDYSQMPGYRRE